MDRLRRPPLAGALASVVTAVLVLVPFALPEVDAPTVSEYYGYGLLGGWSVLVVALVAAVAFASGSERRTDPDVVAGATLVFGLLALLLATWWAMAVPYDDLIVVMTDRELFTYHRHALVGSAAAMVVASAWYAYALDLF